MDRVRILTGEKLSNGDRPIVITCAVGEGSNVIGEFAFLFECSGRIRVESIQSAMFSSEDVVFDELKVAVLNQLGSFLLDSSPSSREMDNNQKSNVSLVEEHQIQRKTLNRCREHFYVSYGHLGKWEI